jgi:thiamine kinase-like enzyme
MAETSKSSTISRVMEQYDLPGTVTDFSLLVNGHINETFQVALTAGDQTQQFILQRINGYVFKEPIRVMNNIQLITRHLAGKITGQDCGVISFLNNRQGTNYTCLEGEYWRLCQYVENSVAYESVENSAVLESAGYAFGRFQELLSDMPLDDLTETIPGFHDTPARLNMLFQAAASDPLGRASAVQAELEFFSRNRALAGSLAVLQKRGLLPLRVTHNDTKYNNILMDRQTGKPLCVIDLDTVMPGLTMFDFGDAIRFAANSAAEDEADLSKVFLNLAHYEAFTRGFIRAAKGFLTSEEAGSMALGAIVITIELASRFLADYLTGDKYFRIHREGHNLDRARSQIQLARDMISQLDRMDAIVQDYYQ